MSGTFNHGGQRRTIQAPCGFISRGSVREANNKMKLHQRVCQQCKGIELPTEFNKVNGLTNGWGGCDGKGRHIGQSTAVVAGEDIGQMDVKMKGNLQQSIEKTAITINALLGLGLDTFEIAKMLNCAECDVIKVSKK